MERREYLGEMYVLVAISHQVSKLSFVVVLVVRIGDGDGDILVDSNLSIMQQLTPEVDPARYVESSILLHMAPLLGGIGLPIGGGLGVAMKATEGSLYTRPHIGPCKRPHRSPCICIKRRRGPSIRRYSGWSLLKAV